MSTPKKRGLGRGLNALMGGDAASVLEPEQAQKETDLSGVQEVDIRLISPDKTQPRKNFDDASLKELADSIKQFGIIQPLIVQKKSDYYQIIAGERRFRAAMKAGLKKIPVIIKEYNPQETLEISLIENIQRENLDPIEEAEAYQRLIKEYHLKQDEVAQRVGKSRPAVANSLRLLKLGDELKAMVAAEELSTGHAKVLLGVENEALQSALAKKCAEDGWSVRQLEKAVELSKKRPEAPKKAVEKTAEDLAYEKAGEEMQQILGTKVQIVRGKKKSCIEIEYYSEDELERLMMLIRSLRS